jgi:hypothetical protein
MIEERMDDRPSVVGLPESSGLGTRKSLFEAAGVVELRGFLSLKIDYRAVNEKPEVSFM